MDDCSCSGWNLIVIKGGENVRRIAAVNAISILVQHVDIDEVRPGIHAPRLIHAAAAPQNASLVAHFHIHPDLVGISGPLSEQMTKLECPYHHFEEVRFTRLQSGNAGSDGSFQGCIHRPAFLEAKKLDLDVALVEVLVRLLDPIGRLT